MEKSRIKINVFFFLKIQPTTRERSLLRLVKIRMKQSARRTARKKITPDDDDDVGRRQSPLATCLVYVFFISCYYVMNHLAKKTL